MTPEFLTLDDLIDSHTEQLANYGWISGIRDLGLLESARGQPESQFGGQYLHAGLFEMAAAYFVPHGLKPSVHRRQQTSRTRSGVGLSRNQRPVAERDRRRTD